VSLSTIKRWQEEEKLVPVLDGNDVHRFDPAEVQELAQQQRSGGADAVGMLEGAAGMVEAQTGNIKSDQRHIEKLLSLVIDPATTLITIFKEEIHNLRERTSQLEDKNFEMLEHFEEATTLAHQRAMEEKIVDAGIKRKDMGLKMLMDYVPMIAMQMISGSKMNPQLKVMLEMIHGLDGEKLSFLKMSGFITEEHFEKLRLILTKEQREALEKIESAMKAAPAEPEAPPAAAAPATPTPSPTQKAKARKARAKKSRSKTEAPPAPEEEST
jgi:hypothetical protein